MEGQRSLCVVADDYGIGPATSAAILDLARAGRVTATVLLVPSPHAEEAVRAWRRAAPDADLGWHPCLTLDRPILPAGRVPSLVDKDGFFYPLRRFLPRALLGQLNEGEVEAELAAQLRRFRDLVGSPPPLVNSHHHAQVFGPVGQALVRSLGRLRPWVRRVREPWRLLPRVGGARLKRVFLSTLGRSDARRLDVAGFPGNDVFLGVTDPACVRDPAFFARWLRAAPGQTVELMCHPGHHDPTLIGRDCAGDDAFLERRAREFDLLQRPPFRDAYRAAGFSLARPSFLAARSQGAAYAA